MAPELIAPRKEDFLANLEQVRENIARAAAEGGRNAADIVIGAVTKNFDSSAILMAKEAGIKLFCENRVQEAALKYGALPGGPEPHLIGHLQTNKAAKAVEIAGSIDSLDSLRIAEAVSRAALKRGKAVEVMLEVNIGNDPAKSGVPFEEIDRLCESVSVLPFLSLTGLMTILPLGCSQKEKMRYFSKLFAKYVDIRDQKQYTNFKYLSMGMSGDYVEAVLCGATTLRIGTALFGRRCDRN